MLVRLRDGASGREGEGLLVRLRDGASEGEG